MNRPSDWREREQARNPLHSYIVQAPAGSGKTELLTQRILELLARVEHPEEVIAITFTRKAAAEMRHRLVRHLQAAARADDDEPLAEHEYASRCLALAVLKQDQERGWNLLEQPSRLRVRTIDSLCSELARQLPVLSGLGGGQQIAADATPLYRMAATRTMAVIEDSKDPLQADVIRVLDRYDNQYDKLIELLTSMLASREQWLGHLMDARTPDGFDRQGLEESLNFLVQTQLESTRNLIPDSLLAALPAFYNYALSNQPTDEAGLRALMAASGGDDCTILNMPASAAALVHWNTMINSLLIKDGNGWRRQADLKMGFPAPSNANGEEKVRRKQWKDDFVELLDPLRDNDKLREALHTIRSLPGPAYEDEAWESLQSLMRLMLRAAGEWKLVLAETGEVDFSEITDRAIQSLGFEDEPSDLALRLDYRIRHLLVDEFQDTSISQIQLLNRLTAGWAEGDGRSLFLVGDPMQSIYRFRKAEVSLFIRAWEGQLFDHIDLIPLQLRVNFRSTQPIVDWVNQTFPLIMPRHNDPVMGAVCYSEASSKPEALTHGAVASRILPERDDREEARQIVALIEDCDPQESIAILVRSRSHAREILAQLDRLKEAHPRFRYQAIDFNPLAKTTLIQDLVSLTLALVQPADRLAWLSTLRAPFVGLDMADLDVLVAGESGSIILDALEVCSDPALDEAHSLLSEDGRRRLQRVAPVLQNAVAQRGRQTVRSQIESSWLLLGGPACVESESELEDAATYFDLLESLESQNLPIDHDTLSQRMEKLHARPDASANGKLQVMTIFSAKGLQFDTVILPGLNNKPASDRDKLLHWFELAGENRIVMSPMRNQADKENQKKSGDLIQYISSIEKQRRSLEDRRLLYVAATRAVKNLYMFAAIKPSAKDEIKADSRSLMGSLWPAIQSDHEEQIREAARILQDSAIDGAVHGNGSAAPVLPQEYRRLNADWRLPDPPSSVQIQQTESPVTQDYIEFSWAGEDARLTGNLVHRLLQLIAEQGQANWQASGGMKQRENWCRAQLASEGVRKDKADRVIARARRAIENCLTSEHGNWILDTHQDSHCEYALTAVMNGQARNMVLDRSFVADNCRWIIDYKTSSHSGGDLEGFLKSEVRRYREQLLRYRDAVAITETRPIRMALYFPLLDRFCEVASQESVA